MIGTVVLMVKLCCVWLIVGATHCSRTQDSLSTKTTESVARLYDIYFTDLASIMILFCFMLSVKDLLLWRDPKHTGPVLGFLIVILLSLTCCSVFSVTSYLLLFILLGALIVRVVSHVRAKVHTGDDTHPFK